MPGIYARWMNHWENKLANQDANRVLRPFEWGLDWLDLPVNDPRATLREFASRTVDASDSFFRHEPRSDYELKNGHLTFTSALTSPFPENNLVHAEFFPVRSRRRAVLVLPQWNADAQGHIGLCKLLNRFGLTALRLSLAYHDRRMPPELARADYHVSSNIGRTIHACRQSILDARACLDWLQARGYSELGILGTSLGSCIAFITAAHDRRIHAGVFNHVSTYFGDVVWTGVSTRHVRQGFGACIAQEELREYWAPISPASYLDRLSGRDLKSLLVWARYDTSFLPLYSLEFMRRYRQCGLWHKTFMLPCGHYTTGQFPFNILDGLIMCGFLSRHLE